MTTNKEIREKKKEYKEILNDSDAVFAHIKGVNYIQTKKGIRRLDYFVDQIMQIVEESVKEIIKCKSCNGSGNTDSMAGARECEECGGVGHRVYGEEGTSLDELSSLKKV